MEIKAFKRTTENWTKDCWCQPCKVSHPHTKEYNRGYCASEHTYISLKNRIFDVLSGILDCVVLN